MDEDVIDVKAREVHEHRSFRCTNGPLFGSKAQWKGWSPRQMIVNLVIALAVGGVYAYLTW